MFELLKRRINAFKAANRGNALLEVGLAAPIVALILTAMLDIGSMAYDTMALQNASRVGAQYAMRYPNDTAGIQQAVFNSTGLKPGSLTVTNKSFCECSNGASVTCGGVCADGKPFRTFISVTVKQTYNTLLPYPGMQKQFLLAGQSAFRLQ